MSLTRTAAYTAACAASSSLKPRIQKPETRNPKPEPRHGLLIPLIAKVSSAPRPSGAHVIVTFFPEDDSEEKQILGRTCRQDDPGSARKVPSQHLFQTLPHNPEPQILSHNMILHTLSHNPELAATSHNTVLQTLWPNPKAPTLFHDREPRTQSDHL